MYKRRSNSKKHTQKKQIIQNTITNTNYKKYWKNTNKKIKILSDYERINEIIHAIRIDFEWESVLLNIVYKWLVTYGAVTFLVPRETAAVLVHVLCTHYNHAPFYNAIRIHTIYIELVLHSRLILPLMTILVLCFCLLQLFYVIQRIQNQHTRALLSARNT